MDAGSCGAIQGANNAKIMKITTNTTPVAARGLWRAVRRNEMVAVWISSYYKDGARAEKEMNAHAAFGLRLYLYFKRGRMPVAHRPKGLEIAHELCFH